ncbi:DUF480 domain-containing protein [Roseimicrobium sp. ORNL1]|nr:YceH family protein [Roseimicrobium sp. ORNL1]QIF00189.1 DUF480 domain-containing protein [Roseimicrobium sp. ORNL1]
MNADDTPELDSIDEPAEGATTPSASSTLQPLTYQEVRVLGCLVEKEMTTPEYYPLTLNALVAACNQTTNREPVLKLDEDTVREALEGLKSRGYALQVTLAGARVQKYKHNLGHKLPRLEKPTLALLCVLLLRGPQTAGELRQRAERMHAFADIPATESAIRELMTYPETPLVESIPAGGGRKTITYVHLLGGPVETSGVATSSAGEAAVQANTDIAWRERLENEIANLRDEVAELKRRLGSLELREAGGSFSDIGGSGSTPRSATLGGEEVTGGGFIP